MYILQYIPVGNSREVKAVVTEYKKMLREPHNSSASSSSSSTTPARNGDQYAPNKVLITKDEFLDLEQMKEQVCGARGPCS